MQAYKNIQTNSLCNCIIELSNGKYALSIGNTISIINNDTESIENTITLNEKTINRIIQLKNKNIATCSDEGFIKIYSIDNFQVIQTINEPNKITNINELSNGELLSINVDKKMRFYKFNKDKYEINYIYEEIDGEMLVDSKEINNKKIIYLSYSGMLLKLKVYDMNKRKTVKLLSYHIAKFWNNYSNMLLINKNTLAISIYDCVTLVDTETASIKQVFGDYINEEFITPIGIYDEKTILVYCGLEKYAFDFWKVDEDGIYEKTEQTQNLNDVCCILKTSNGKIITGEKTKITFWNIN
jgi:hypothetical protein